MLRDLNEQHPSRPGHKGGCFQSVTFAVGNAADPRQVSLHLLVLAPCQTDQLLDKLEGISLFIQGDLAA
jgi:hypothetical protein